MKVFVSHSRKDRWVARQIAQELERRGITTVLVDDQQDDVQRQTIAYQESRKAREGLVVRGLRPL